MTTRRCAIVMLTTVALPAPVRAISPALCRQTMAGLFKAEDGRIMPVELLLRIRSDDNDLSIRGRFRCTAKRDPSRCFIGATKIDALGFSVGGGRLMQSTRNFRLTHGGPYSVVCDLTATTPFVRNLCIPALGGTFACRNDGEFGSVSGAFGVAVDSCAPCLSPRH